MIKRSIVLNKKLKRSVPLTRNVGITALNIMKNGLKGEITKQTANIVKERKKKVYN